MQGKYNLLWSYFSMTYMYHLSRGVQLNRNSMLDKFVLEGATGNAVKLRVIIIIMYTV